MTLYYEAHVTIEPVFDDRLAEFAVIATAHDFRVADLLMKKRAEDTAERSQHDSFCTGRAMDRDILLRNMIALILRLRHHGFQVWRYKIEDTLIDSRNEDVLSLITPPESEEHDDDDTRSPDLSGEPEPEGENPADHPVRASDLSGGDYINRQGHRALWVY